MKRKVTFQLILIFFVINLFGQIDVKNFDYRKADSIALNFPKIKYKSYTEIAGPLTDNLDSDHEKFRAIFRWIAENIKYSYSNRTCDPDKVIKKGKAVCSGYSSLLQAMCESVGLESMIITGYSKTAVSDINKGLTKTDHAWNAIKLYDKWYLVDVTWAWGYHETKTKKFIKEYNNNYFLTDPDFFYKKHLPKDKKLFLTEKTIKKSDFIKSPIVYNGLINNNIKSIFPSKGEIKIRLKDTLQIKIQTENVINDFTIELKNDRYGYQPNVSKQGDIYVLKQKFEKRGEFTLTIFANHKAVATYRLKIK